MMFLWDGSFLTVNKQLSLGPRGLPGLHLLPGNNYTYLLYVSRVRVHFKTLPNIKSHLKLNGKLYS